MTQHLADYWGHIEDCIHPDDEFEFERHPEHGFNLDFPPPAFVGDIINAPIIILDNNGGYDPEKTPGEFPDAEARAAHRDMLAKPRPISRHHRSVSPYYLGRNYTGWLEEGVAALVNGVAYRSVSGRDKFVAKITRSLPSALFHQEWLTSSLLPLLNNGERFVIVHRWTRWNQATASLRGHPNAVFSPALVSKDLSTAEIEAARNFLGRR